MSVARANASSLARQFAGLTAAMAIVATLLISAASWWWIDRLQHDAARLLAQREANARADQVRDTLAAIHQRLREIASGPLLQTALTDSLGRDAYLAPYLGGVQAVNGVRVELLLVDFQGAELGRNGDVAFSAEDRELLMRSLRQGRDEALQVAGADGDDIILALAVRYQRTGTVEGAVWARVQAAQLLRDSGYRLLTRGAAAAAADATLAAVTLAPPLAGLQLVVAREGRPPDLQDRLVAPATGVALTALLLMAGLALLGRHLARRLTADLDALERFAGTAAAQSFGTARAPETGAREVASLARSLNTMLEQLNRQHASEQDAAREQLNLLATCIANLNDVVMVTDVDPAQGTGQRIKFVNEAFTRQTGYTPDEVIGRTPHFLQGPQTDRAELDRIRAALIAWEPVRASVTNYRKDGSHYRVEMEIVPVKDAAGEVRHWVAVERDITARHEAEQTQAVLEAQVREAQKLEAIGTLAAGIAHDFNNILAAVLGNLELARQDLDRGTPPRSRLEQIERSAKRARKLVDQILTYSRRQDGTLRHANEDLKALVEEVISLLRATIPARVRLTSIPCDLPVTIKADAVAIEQVLMNLGTNAWQALQGQPGDVTFGVTVVDIDAAGAPTPRVAVDRAPALPLRLSLPAGAYSVVWVADTGCGMDEATKARIYEPFFSTRSKVGGTGLGLSVVQGIVRAHGGAIEVTSAPGAGSVFFVLLPLSTEAVAAAPADLPATPAGRGQRVLCIDDDPLVIAMLGYLLDGWGYQVKAVLDAAEAMQALRAAPDAWDLVITDLNMPEHSGLDVLAQARALRPDLPIILTSGHISEDVQDQASRAGAFDVLRKEHLPEELGGVVARALQAHAAMGDLPTS
jgi:PAS domain S-box-containing protein